ncbi:uncharacterized protein Z518_08999 [Rhinocladiella mackenziei CBS 650.93]|uniref:DUF7708 domain-containing protein n=1 Tax=Rhinocladiella mackenziei CBS 650.93 TaxID=1442369 RepID=A0A0D2I642_9EURO|nr:uncharacterized protein Z518_08999 [Rhinocladiella mackenziei CBS 650.93]KIX01274.1 hypothetical protein Z518_08999 [Rhinocladiella mackenziei CBS 650.93]
MHKPSEGIHSDAWNDALQRLDSLDARKQKAYDNLSDAQKGVLRSSTDAGAIGKLLLSTIDRNKSVKRLLKFNSAALQPFYQFEKSFSQAAQANAAIVSPVWSPILLVLQCTINVAEGFAKIYGTLNTILDRLLRIDEYEKLYCSPRDSSRSKLVQMALTRFYGDVIEFCLLAVAHYNRSALKSLARGLVTTFDGDFKEVMDNLETHMNELSWVANLADKHQQKQHMKGCEGDI